MQTVFLMVNFTKRCLKTSQLPDHFLLKIIKYGYFSAIHERKVATLTS